MKVGDKVVLDPNAERNIRDNPTSYGTGFNTEYTILAINLDNGININDYTGIYWRPDRFTVVTSGGAKFDDGKLMFRPLTRGLAKPLRAVAAVLTYGAQKYAEDSWQTVPDGEKRYENAMDRHINEWKLGEEFDSESGLHHLAHIACNALFLLWFTMQSSRNAGHDYFNFNKPPVR